MRYLLDTNAVIALQKLSPILMQRLTRHHPNDIGISSISAHEIYFGAYKSARVERNIAEFDILQFAIVDFGREDALRAGEIRAGLRARGTPIGPYDLLIAGQALTRRLVVVTRNVAEFARVEGLAVENWEGAAT